VELGEILRERRRVAGRTIASVAVDAGLSVPYIANLENGRGNPTVAALDRLATALGARLEVGIAADPPLDPSPAGDRSGEASAGADLLMRSDRSAQVINALAAARSRSRSAVRADLIRALDALSAVLDHPPADADLNRLLDLLLLAGGG